MSETPKQRSNNPAVVHETNIDVKSTKKERRGPKSSGGKIGCRARGHRASSRIKHTSMTSHQIRSNRVRSISPADVPMSPQASFRQGGGSQCMSQAAHPQYLPSTPQHFQYWSTASSSSAQNEDQSPSKTEPHSYEKQYLFLGNFPVDVTIKPSNPQT